MKEIDDTPVPENESEDDLEVRIGLLEVLLSSLEVEFAGLHHDVARLLEARAQAMDPTDLHADPEWF
jgi:hypothetical protein